MRTKILKASDVQNSTIEYQKQFMEYLSEEDIKKIMDRYEENLKPGISFTEIIKE